MNIHGVTMCYHVLLGYPKQIYSWPFLRQLCHRSTSDSPKLATVDLQEELVHLLCVHDLIGPAFPKVASTHRVQISHLQRQIPSGKLVRAFQTSCHVLFNVSQCSCRGVFCANHFKTIFCVRGQQKEHGNMQWNTYTILYNPLLYPPVFAIFRRFASIKPCCRCGTRYTARRRPWSEMLFHCFCVTPGALFTMRFNGPIFEGLENGV